MAMARKPPWFAREPPDSRKHRQQKRKILKGRKPIKKPDSASKNPPVKRKHHTSAADSPDSSKPDLLMKLSAELRNKIYDYVLEPKPYWYRYMCMDWDPRVVKSGKWKEPGLPMVSKQVRSEALPMYYAKNDFKFWVKVDELEGLRRFLDAAKARYGEHFDPRTQLVLGPFGTGTKIVLRNFKWTDLASLLPLVKLIAEHPIVGYMWGMWDPNSPNPAAPESLYDIYVEAVKLGLKARVEKWHPAVIELEFDEWVENMLDEKGPLRRLRGRAMTKPTPGDLYGVGMGREWDVERGYMAALRVPDTDRVTRSMALPPAAGPPDLLAPWRHSVHR